MAIQNIKKLLKIINNIFNLLVSFNYFSNCRLRNYFSKLSFPLT